MNRPLRPFVALAIVAASALVPAQDEFTRTDPQKEIELGREAYDAMLRQGLISKNEAATNRVNRIFATLLRTLPERLYPYQVVLIGTSEINAGCLPGGYICIYEGLVSQLKSDDAIAFTLAHEMGHAARRHWVRQVRNKQSDILRAILVEALGGTPDRNGALRERAHSREHEREADAFGVEVYLRAGYDPLRITDTVEVLQHFSPDSGRIPYYLRTHPPHAERITLIERHRSELLAKGLTPVTPTVAPELAPEALFGKLPDAKPAENPLFPLRSGETWEYTIKDVANSSYKISVVGAGDHAGGRITRLRLELGGTRTEYQCFTTGAEVFRRNRPQSASSPWEVETAFPMDDTPITHGKWTFQRLEPEDVTTPLATYPKAVKIEAKRGDRTLHLWFAPGIGLIRRLNVATGTDELLFRHHPGG